MAMQIYTNAELLAKIKALDLELEAATTESRLDTQLNEHEWHESIAEKRKQRDMYFRMLQDQTNDNSKGKNIHLLPCSRWLV